MFRCGSQQLFLAAAVGRRGRWGPAWRQQDREEAETGSSKEVTVVWPASKGTGDRGKKMGVERGA